LYQMYKKPMQEKIESKELPLTDEQMTVLFANLEDLINVNTELLKSLIKRLQDWSEEQKIGDVLLQLAPFLRLYTLYSLNFERANEILQELATKVIVKTFLDNQLQDPVSNGLDFSAYLIMPIQRIPRYRLLLEELINNTDKNHPDYKDLEESLVKLKSVAEEVNKAVVEQEAREKMYKVCKKFIDFKERELVKPGRKFIHEGELSKICRKDRQRRSFFLFSDVLVYAYPATPGKFRVGREFRLFTMKTKDIPDSKLKKMLNAFQITSESKSFIVLADTPEQKLEWLDLISKAQEADKIRSETLARNQEEVVNTTAPVWVPDAEAKTCSLCSTKFTFTNRRHHCRQCGNVVCGPCSDQKKVLPGQGKVRVCTECLTKPVEADDGQHIPINGSSSDDDSEPDVLFELPALYDYVPPPNNAGSQKLKFNKGDIICVLQMDDSGWWLGEHNGERGWVPASFLQAPNSDE